MMPDDWKIQRFEEYPDTPIRVATYRQIQQFNWWFDGKKRKELIIGLSYKNGHAYLIAGKYELHGHLYFKKIRTKLFSRFLTLRPILFFRFPNFDASTIEEIEKDIEARVGSREISCIELIRLVLERGAGMKMLYFEPSMIYLQQYVDSFLKYGFINSNNGAKVPLEVYLCESWKLPDLYDHLSRLEKRFYWLGHSGLWLARLCRAPGNFLKWVKGQRLRAPSKTHLEFSGLP